VPDLPRLEADFTTSISFANADVIRVVGDAADPDWFRLRGELVQLGLFQGFDELLCCRCCVAWRRTGTRSRQYARC